ncbi:MAG: DUF2834 domain-containing protein [bacterium]
MSTENNQTVKCQCGISEFGFLKPAKIAIIIVLLLFSVLTFLALRSYGFLGIFKLEFQNFGTMQVFADLIISSILVLFWIKSDSKKNNRLFWPWALLTLAIGSFGPLLYLLFSKSEKK